MNKKHQGSFSDIVQVNIALSLLVNAVYSDGSYSALFPDDKNNGVSIVSTRRVSLFDNLLCNTHSVDAIDILL